MEEANEKIKHDLDYYKSGIKQLYVRSYQLYMMGLIAIMLLTALGIGGVASFLRILLIVLFIIEIAGLIYLLRFLKEETFEEYFQTIYPKLAETFPAMIEGKPQEDNQAYYFLDSQSELIKLNKRNIRNFPSTMRQFTLLVGFNFEMDFEQPLHFYYYDITNITHSESYKKELLKSTNFLIKRRNRRLKNMIVMLIGIVFVSIILYVYGTSFFQ
ncbi:hypothetical protein [Candidatus Enterococcus mansonii]|uniref:Uncharacterized protein n=1 Tax=Candidatus Enterococcus mansonii TaxID=1834181 RepID=A0A242CIQ5_9ENTE|nr:hypothetical protein [Enterococcus sp. 4G2_DIV0659]OTO10008.1 hypothetical protein A5880_000691 [Enterococcus sp. 4G2_DIV0659]